MTRRLLPSLVLAGCAAAAGAVPAAPAAAQDFTWRGRVARGRTVEVKGVNGDVRALAASGAEVEVTAVKRARRSDPDEVDIEVIEHEGGVTICAVYPTPPRARRENRCAPGDEWHSNTEDNDVSVDFTVRVPAGVEFDGRTVNGDVDVEAVPGDAHVSTVNGSVEVSAAGLVEATTVNGGITARLGRADWTGELEFHTVNGGITLYLPEGLSAEIDAQTVNGDIESDWPVTISGRFGPRRMRGTIGNGGRSLELRTVNGSIRLLKNP